MERKEKRREEEEEEKEVEEKMEAKEGGGIGRLRIMSKTNIPGQEREGGTYRLWDGGSGCQGIECGGR